MSFAPVLLSLAVWTPSTAVQPHEVFPFERLDEGLRPRAEKLLLDALDSEALYTLIGGLKPISSSWHSVRLPSVGPDPEPLSRAIVEAEQARVILEQFRVGDTVSAGLQPFSRRWQDERLLHAILFHHGSVRATVEKHEGFFAWAGVTPSTPPMEIVLTVENDETPARHRGYGLLFGYPDHAVEFFVQADIQARRTGEFVQRDFLRMPTFGSQQGQFVYAVPKGHVPRAEDLRIRALAEAIYVDYAQRRERFIGEGKAGALALVRDWLCDSEGCSPEVALSKSLARSGVSLH